MVGSNKIREGASVGKDIGHWFKNDAFADVTLVVNGQRFPVHKVVLASRSEYFRTFFLADMKESSQKEIKIDEPDASSFERLLKFIYTGEMDLHRRDEDDSLEMLRLANKYLFSELQSSISWHLQSILTLQNFCKVFQSMQYLSARQIDTVKRGCMQLVDKNPIKILELDGILNFDSDSTKEIIGRYSYENIQPVVFEFIQKWIEANGQEGSVKLLSTIDLSRMPIEYLTNTVRPSGLFSEKDILEAISIVEAVQSMPPSFLNQQQPSNALPETSTTMPSGRKRRLPKTPSEKPSKKSIPQIFSGLTFTLTHAYYFGDAPLNRMRIACQIELYGGAVVEDFLQLPETTDFRTCFLLSDSYQQTRKYYVALALGIRCVKMDYIFKSMTAEKLLDRSSFMLHAGHYLEESRFLPWHNKSVNLFSGMSIVIHSENSANKKDVVEIWTPLLKRMGGNVIENWQESGTRMDILITDPGCPKSMITAAESLGGKVVSLKWLLQCIVTGQVRRPDAHPDYAYNKKWKVCDEYIGHSFGWRRM